MGSDVEDDGIVTKYSDIGVESVFQIVRSIHS